MAVHALPPLQPVSRLWPMLPTDVLLLVMGRLCARDDRTMASVCRAWRAFFDDAAAVARVYHARFGETPPLLALTGLQLLAARECGPIRVDVRRPPLKKAVRVVVVLFPLLTVDTPRSKTAWRCTRTSS